jgi:hypothetical protein
LEDSKPLKIENSVATILNKVSKEGKLILEETRFTIKIIGIINTIINFLLMLFFFILLIFVPSGYMQFIILGLFMVSINIMLGIGVISLNNLARKLFIIVQIISLLLSIWPFGCMFTLGLGSAGRFAGGYVAWAPTHAFLFWQQLASFVFGMMLPVVPMLFSAFCIFYLTRSEISEQFKF